MVENAQFDNSPLLLRIVEAILFASSEPVSRAALIERLPENSDVDGLMNELTQIYSTRGVNLNVIGDAYAFRTAPDLAYLLSKEQQAVRKLSRAALEVLAIIAYHQPITRAELEDIRGVETSKGTLDVLMETGWIKIRGRRRTPGRPVTYGTTQDFLDHFTLPDISDLPGMEELKGAGLLSSRLPENFNIPIPSIHIDELSLEEEPYEDIDLEQLGLLPPKDMD